MAPGGLALAYPRNRITLKSHYHDLNSIDMPDFMVREHFGRSGGRSTR
jgi:hypothetical protein